MFLKVGLIGLVVLAVLVSACTAPTPKSAQNTTTAAATQGANATPITAKILPLGSCSDITRDVQSKIDAMCAEDSALNC